MTEIPTKRCSRCGEIAGSWVRTVSGAGLSEPMQAIGPAPAHGEDVIALLAPSGALLLAYRHELIVCPHRTRKRCRGCGQVKALVEYHRDRAKADGHAVRCKACQREGWRAANRRVAARRKALRAAMQEAAHA